MVKNKSRKIPSNYTGFFIIICMVKHGF